MKTRNGFVSNSSSSSFIIGHIDIGGVANAMLHTIIEDFRECEEEDLPLENRERYNKWIKNLQRGLRNENVISGKVGITMPSCNYETYIFKKDRQIYR